MNGQRKALIVANDQYDHEGLRHLVSPAADAEALAGVLGDEKIGQFDVRVVRNEPAHVIQGQIEDLFSDSRRDDVLLLHFSCHGLKSESGELFFAARDTRPNRLASTAIPADFVQRCMRASRSRSIVLLLDCCYGGAFGQGVTVRAAGDVDVLGSFPGGRLGGGRGRAVITASSAMEYAFEGDQLADDHSQRPSVFTTALVEGLATGEADRDEDGFVSLNELYDYVFDRVRAENPHQTPSRDVEMQGELYVARSRRRRIRPQPIPADLQAAMTDPNMFARLGAVTELRGRLLGDNLPAAVGARDALTDIAANDLQYIADAAAAALNEAVLRPSEHELHFGPVTQDSGRAHRTIHLQGPPLARACTFQVSHAWIRIDETPEGIDVSVDASTVGRLHGDIALAGPTGEAVITVDVEVTPSPPQPSASTTKPPPSRDELPTYNRATASTPTRTPQPDGPPARPAPPPAPDSPSPQPAAPAHAKTGTPHDTGVPTSLVPGHTATPPVIRRGKRPGIRQVLWVLIQVLWALIPVLSLGFLLPVPFAHAAVRLHDRRLWLITTAYVTAWVPLLITALATDPVADYLLLALIVVATAHALWLRRRVFAHARTGTPHDTGVPTSLVPGHTATPPVIRRGKRPGIRQVLWVLIPVLSLGFLLPVPFAHAAVRLHDRRLWLITTAYVTAWVPLLITALATDPGYLYLALIVVATAHALWLRRRVFAEPSASPPPTEP